ncbi:YdcH family protein [Marinobacter sediminum]|uniref:YdcH family protein n=1 Tax=Marinobacter sediminum TaxID=256323 RepID=UPI00202E983F|nr:YdcH family protein [Marinobacter sediminum]MCM0613605.1 YdcH family protein [Marinobacter sediminum]
MSLEKHDLLHELPESKEAIHLLKTNSNHFAKLFDEYHELDHEIHRIETGAENTADEYLETQKKQRLSLKDQLYTMIREYEASTAS